MFLCPLCFLKIGVWARASSGSELEWSSRKIGHFPVDLQAGWSTKLVLEDCNIRNTMKCIFIPSPTFLLCVFACVCACTCTYVHKQDCFRGGGVYFHQDIHKYLVVSHIVMFAFYMHCLTPLLGFTKALDIPKWFNSIILRISAEILLYREAISSQPIIWRKKS